MDAERRTGGWLVGTAIGVVGLVLFLWGTGLALFGINPNPLGKSGTATGTVTANGRVPECRDVVEFTVNGQRFRTYINSSSSPAARTLPQCLPHQLGSEVVVAYSLADPSAATTKPGSSRMRWLLLALVGLVFAIVGSVIRPRARQERT